MGALGRSRRLAAAGGLSTSASQGGGGGAAGSKVPLPRSEPPRAKFRSLRAALSKVPLAPCRLEQSSARSEARARRETRGTCGASGARCHLPVMQTQRGRRRRRRRGGGGRTSIACCLLYAPKEPIAIRRAARLYSVHIQSASVTEGAWSAIRQFYARAVHSTRIKVNFSKSFFVFFSFKACHFYSLFTASCHLVSRSPALHRAGGRSGRRLWVLREDAPPVS